MKKVCLILLLSLFFSIAYSQNKKVVYAEIIGYNISLTKETIKVEIDYGQEKKIDIFMGK